MYNDNTTLFLLQFKFICHTLLNGQIIAIHRQMVKLQFKRQRVVAPVINPVLVGSI